MAVGFPTQDEQLRQGGWETLSEPGWGAPAVRIDALAIALLILVIFLAFQLIADSHRGRSTTVEGVENIQKSEPITSDSPETIEAIPENLSPALPLPDPSAIIYPYDDYWLTQGPHGMSYGHLAIDLAAGKGAAIKSPIFGTVAANYIDQYGNTTLVIENERYLVTLLHGDYSAAVGQAVNLGDPVGAENNHGYTTDFYGNSCRGRDCGYHTHLNVFDKSINQNVNPLDVLAR